MTGMVLLALVPVAILIACGWWLRRSGFLGESFWPGAERLSYFVLLPALFVHGLATADLGHVPVLRIAVALIGPILAVAGLIVAARRLIGGDDAAFTSVFQGGIRFNSYVGVTIATGLFGPTGLALAAVATVSIVPTVNLLCILVFARHGTARPTPLGIARQVLFNPLVASCLIGGVLQATGFGLPRLVEPALKSLGLASLPLGLLCVGAAFDASALGSGLRATAFASLAKFVALPAMTAVAAAAAGLSGAAMAVALLFQALPTASSSYILARQLGGDARLMAAIVALQTVLAAGVIPIVMTLGAG